MLPKKHRIGRRFFNEVFSRGQFFGGDNLSGKILDTKTDNLTCFAIVAQKKILKSAVDRNRLRRRVYSAITPLLPHLKPGFAIIVFVKPSLLTIDIKALQEMLVNLLKHHNVI